jgi:hypothetical protein
MSSGDEDMDGGYDAYMEDDGYDASGAGSQRGGSSVMGDSRVLKACGACHRAKSKCDGGNPCASCKRRGIDCVYFEQRKRGPKTGALRQLQEEVASLRAQLKAQSAPGGAGASGSSTGAHPSKAK